MFTYIEKQISCTGIQPNSTVPTFDLFLPYPSARYRSESPPSMGFSPNLEPNSCFTGLPKKKKKILILQEKKISDSTNMYMYFFF